MRKTALSLLLTLFCAFGVLAINRSVASSEVTPAAAAETIEKVDYAGQLKLDSSAATQKLELEVKTFVDGDTTHFYAEDFPNGVLKARYAAVNTPESTGKLEEWGKKAAGFTREKLTTATSIIVESDGPTWAADSTGDRYLCWVWYKAPGASDYRNLNLELLQEGLGRSTKVSESRYAEVCSNAIYQATQLKLHIWSGEQDPDFFYGDSIEMDLKELRLNLEKYKGKRVAFEGVVSYYVNQGVYVEDYDEDTNMYYGMYVYYGFFLSDTSALAIGNRVRVTGVLQYYEAGDSYQVSDLKYSAFFPTADDIRVLGQGYTAANVELTPTEYNQKVTVTDEEAGTSKLVPYAELAMNTSVSMKGLYVKDVYTTDNGGNNDGAMTLTCQADGQTVKVRTIVLKDSAGNIATEDMLKGKTIDVTGIIDTFNGEYQIKIISLAGILVDGEPIFPPVEQPTPPAGNDSTSDVTSDTDSVIDSTVEEEKPLNITAMLGCSSALAISAILPVMAVAVVLFKKREN